MPGPPLGNTNGARRNRVFSDTLKRMLAQHPERVEKIALKLIQDAENGDHDARTLLIERVDGKMPQAIVGDDDEPSVKFSRVLRTIVDPAKTADDAHAPTTDG